MNICTSEFADAGSKTGRFSARIKCRAFVVLILLLWSCVAVTYGLPPYFRQPVWTANGTALTYGLTETDPDIFATADAFSYTRWGNVMFEGPLSDPFYFTPLTFGPFNESNGDLFLSDGHGTSGAPLSRHLFAGRAFPIGSNWSTGNFPYQDRWGDVRLNLVSTAPATLFRYLHFPKLLFNELDGQRIGSETMKLKKLIILIHGWNPPNVLADSFITPEFNALSTNLKSRLNDAGRNWGLIHYHWEADADTGGLDWGAGVHNPPEAASIAHLHGQNLGELLATAAPDLEKVHFIAHSAGAWAARSAAKYLLNATLSQNRKIIVQVTLLDPYMPQETPYVGPLSHLGKTLMNRFDEIPGNDRLWQLDNYYSFVDAALATDEEFDWRTSPIDQPFVWGTSDINLRVDYANVAYIGHGGPIQFYAATVAARSSGIASSRLTTAPYPYYQTGWFRSLFELEPLFPKLSDLNAPQDASVQVGGTVTLSCSAVRADTYQWFHNGVPDGRSSGSSLQISNASAADAGEYHVRAQNSAGVTFSRTAHVTVTAAVFAPVITSHPRSGTITAGESITLNVTATGTAPLSYQWLRNSVNIANATGATYITPALQLANSGERYSVRVSNAQGSATSQEAIISVVPAPPPAAADQFEPNESSLTATPIATGAVISALISTSADVDWFRLGLSGAGTLRIALISPAGNDYDIELYGPSGTFLARSYEGAGAFESIAFNVPGSGTYTLRVYGYPQGNGSHNSAAPYFLSTAFDSGQLPPPAYSLSTSATSGTVTKSPNLASYSDGSLVTVTAMPAAGYQFSGWSGAYSGGANPILITMDGNKTLAANFSLIPTGGGNGGTASVRVSIVPQAAADAGAQWKLVTESDWHNSGNIVAVPSFGTYDVEFKAIDGWTKPNNKQVTVSAGLPDIWINSDAYIQHPVVPFIENFRDVAYGNGGFVAVGDSHNVSTSPDSVNWTRRAASSDSYPYRIVFGNGTFVAVCNSQARIITSPDGVTWTNRWNANPSYQFDAITYGNGRFVALAGNRKFMTSTDAVAWTITDSGVPEDLIDVTYGNGQFVAVGDQAVVATSPDGMTWTRRSVGTGAGLYGVTYGNQRYVAVGWAGDIASSPDALTWTRRTSNTSDLLVGVRHGAGTFVAVGYNGALVTSQDGVNWTRRASGTANTLRGIAFGQDKFAAVGLSGTLLNLGNFFPPLIAVQPASHVVKDSLPITLSVQANGAGPFSYQWKLNGSPLPGETGANLSLASATFAQAGNYSVEVSTPGAFQLSQEAVITVVPAQRGTVQFSVGSRLIDEQGGSVSISVIRTVGIDGTVSVNYTTTPGTASTDADFVSTSGVLTLPDGIAEATLTIPIIDDALFEPNESFTIAISNPSPGLLLGMLDHATVTISDLSDSDSDGIPDDYELTHNLNPYDSGDASADPDGDGASNLEEFFAGTNPHDATSKLRVTSFEKVGSEVHIEFPTVLGKSYRVEVSNDLTSNSWTIIADNIIGTGGTIIFIEESLTGTAQRFYRVRVFSP